jgi:hypothetical protein
MPSGVPHEFSENRCAFQQPHALVTRDAWCITIGTNARQHERWFAPAQAAIQKLSAKSAVSPSGVHQR